jgi:hypothetical protein
MQAITFAKVHVFRVLKNHTEYESNLDRWFRGDRENNPTVSGDWTRRCCPQSPLYLCPFVLQLTTAFDRPSMVESISLIPTIGDKFCVRLSHEGF